MLSWGKVNGVEEAGMHVKIPFRDDVVKVNVRTQAATAEAAASSKDMQNVHTTVSVNYHLDPAHVGEIYAKTGLDVEAKIIDPRIQEYVKAVTARYAADELLKQREVVKTAITEALTRELQAYNIIVESGGVQITNFKFDPAYQQAIENKQIAEQKALQATNDLQRIKVYSTKKRFGKLVTVVEGLDKEALGKTAKELKHKLACGGTAKDGLIVLQGDHKDKIKSLLVALGYSRESITVR